MASGEDKDNTLSKVMGFGGFGKKSRQFDFKSIFEETRRNAQERNQKNIERLQIEEEMTRRGVNVVLNVESENKSDDVTSPSKSTSQSEDEDETLIGPPVPKNQSEDEDEPIIGPPIPTNQSDDNDEDDVTNEDEETNDFFIPLSHEIVLSHGIKPVTALSVEPAGCRLVSGGHDFNMKFWDLAGMNNSLQSFRELSPCDCHNMVRLEFSSTGKYILVIASNSQAKVYDRDGYELLQCVKGDQYLNDMYNTKGHTAMLNDGCWNPVNKEEFLTCSNDGTIRTWDVFRRGKESKMIRKCRDKSGRRTQPICCCYSNDGKLLAAASNDGSVLLWDEKKKVNTTHVVRNAHQSGTDTSSIQFSHLNQNMFCTRGGDDTVKLWDLRKLKDPIASACDIPNYFSGTNCTFSPNDKMLMTGCSVKRDDGKKGKLIFLDTTNLEIVNQLEVAQTSIIRSFWHPKINQIFATTAHGKVHVLYDPIKSVRGAKLCVAKRRKKTNHIEMVARQRIITPYSLPLYREDREKSTKKRLEKDRKDPIKSHKPQPPLNSRGGAGGRLKAHGSTLASFVMKSIAKDTFDDTNPREAILRHDEAAKKNPQWITHAYQKTQPKTIFQPFEDPNIEEEEENSHVIVGSNKKPESEEPSPKRHKF